MTGNTLTGNGRGIRVSGAGVAGSTPSIVITNNTISSNITQGVWIDNVFGGNSQNVQLNGNTINANGTDGVQIGTGSTTITLPSGNKITGNHGWGVDDYATAVNLPSASANTVTGNALGNMRKTS